MLYYKNVQILFDIRITIIGSKMLQCKKKDFKKPDEKFSI